MRTFASLLVLALVAAACSGKDAPRVRPDAGAASVRKVKPPPDNRTHVYPPHAIRPDGVGPYLLDASLSDVLHIAPEGPRYEQLELGDLLSWFLVRAENARLLIGADERSRRVAFIVALTADVARTDGGMTVGMSGAALLASLGPTRVEPGVVRARRVYEFEKLPNVQFLTNDSAGVDDADAHVVAVLVSRPLAGAASAPIEPPRTLPLKPSAGGKTAGGKAAPGKLSANAAAAAAREAAKSAPCRSGGELAKVPAAELWQAAHAPRTRPGQVASAQAAPRAIAVSFGCITSDEPEALVLAGEEIAVVGGSPGKLKKLITLGVGAVDQVSPLDVDGDGRDELIALGLLRGDAALAVQLRAWSWEGGRLVTVASQRLFEVTREAAATAGTTPAGIDLWPEVRPGPGALVVGGLYVERTATGVRVVAPLSPVRVRLEPRRGGAPAVDAGDAGVGSGGPASPPPPRGNDPDAGTGNGGPRVDGGASTPTGAPEGAGGGAAPAPRDED